MKLLVLSDIHANFPALKAVIDDVSSYDYAVFLGDSVDYGPNPNEVLEWIKENVDFVLMGNHDKAVAYNIDCMCGERTHELSVYTRNEISLKLLREEYIKYLRSLPEKKIIDIEGYQIYAVHASPLNPLYGYAYPNMSEDRFKKMVLYESDQFEVKKEVTSDMILLGHTHIQFKKKVDNKIIVNPGSVGQPRDGDSRAAYAMIDLDNLNIDFFRTSYPIEETINSFLKLKIAQKYLNQLITILKSGLII